MTTLNNRQQHSYSIAQQLARFLRKSKRIYNNVTPFNNEVNTFLRNLDEIPGQATIKATKGNAITVQKRKLKKEIAHEAAVICTLATAYALGKDDTKLHYQVSHSYTDFYTTHDHLLSLSLYCITHALTPYLENDDFKEYGITAASLTSITEKAEQFKGMISTATWINRDSDRASRNITATLKTIKANIAQLSRLLILLKETHPGFTQDFQQSLIINQKEKAHNTIKGIITDNSTAQPVEGVTITIEGSTKTTATNMSGFYQLAGLKVGTQKIIVTACGCTPQIITVKIMRGKTITQNIHLETQHLVLPAIEVA